MKHRDKDFKKFGSLRYSSTSTKQFYDDIDNEVKYEDPFVIVFRWFYILLGCIIAATLVFRMMSGELKSSIVHEGAIVEGHQVPPSEYEPEHYQSSTPTPSFAARA